MTKPLHRPPARGADTSAMHPTRIWCLWLQGMEQAPPLVRRCLDSWRHWNPEWRVEVLDETRLAALLPELGDWAAAGWTALAPAARSDLIRLALLHRYGGVWTDATCLCRKPLDCWLPALMRAGFFAFDAPGRTRPLATWFLAAEPGNPLLGRWRAAADAYWAHGFHREPVTARELLTDPRYAPHREDTGLWLDPQRPELGTRYPYFWVHYLFERILQETDCAAFWQRVPKVTADIPHRLRHLGFDQPVNAALAREIRLGMAPLYKLDLNSGVDIDDRSTLFGHCLDPANWC
jgi:hypothetical protein